MEAISPTPDDQLGKAEILDKVEKVDKELKNISSKIKALDQKKVCFSSLTLFSYVVRWSFDLKLSCNESNFDAVDSAT